LLASLGANAYLLATRCGAEAEHPRPHSMRTTRHWSSSEQAAIGSARASAVLLPVSPEIKNLDRAALEKRVTETEEKVAKLLPLRERFALADRTPENEERIRPFLDKIFAAKKGDDPRYNVECHGDVCQLTTDVSPYEWQHELQTDPQGIGKFRGMSFGDGTFMELEEPGRAAGIQFLVKVFTAMQDSPRVAECKNANPAPGDLKLIVALDPGSRRLSVSATGSLEQQAGGVCIRRVLEDIVASTPLPPDATSLPSWPMPIVVP